MSQQTLLAYEFGPFRLCLTQRLLLHGREIVPLKPKVFDTLLLLIENRGRVMEKDELMRVLWPDSFVEENSLTQNISLLRRSLRGGDSVRQYVETIPRRGYRFVAEVRELSAEGEEQHAALTRAGSRVSDNSNTRGEENEAARCVDERAVQPVGLESMRSDRGSNRRPGRVPSQRHLALAILILFAAGSAGAFIKFRKHVRSWRDSSGAQTFLKEMRMASLTSLGKVWEAAVSPDGKYIAYVVTEEGKQSLWVKQIEADSSIRIVPPEVSNCIGLTFSPDGSYVFYTTYLDNSNVGVLIQVPVLGGAQRQITVDIDSPVTFSPDGQRMAFLRRHISSDLIEHTLMTANVDGTGERRLSTRGGASNYSAHGPAWSPDGKTLVSGAGNITDDHVAGVVEVSVEDGRERTVSTRTWRRVERVAWLPDKSGLVVIAADPETEQFMQMWHLSYPGGEARRITKDLNHYHGVSLSSDAGRLVTVQADQIVSVWVSRDGDPSHAEQLKLAAGGRLGDVLGLSWTPDGKIVYSSTTGGNTDIWIMQADGTEQRRLTSHAGSDFLPSVSPDGRQVVFLSTRAGVQQLWKMEIDGRNQTRLTEGGMKYRPQWSPDGKWIVYAAIESTETQPTLWKVAEGGGQPVRLTSSYSRIPTVSPDSRLVACYYWDDRASKMKLAVIPFEGGEPLQLLDPPRSNHHWSLQWTPDGRGLLYVQTQSDSAHIWRIPLSGDPPERVMSFASGHILDFAWSKDGSQFACARALTNKDVVSLTGFR